MEKSKVRIIRERLGYTQSYLAEQTNLSIRTIHRVESGQTVPKGHTLKVLAEALGIDKNELLKQEPILKPLSQKEELKLKLINLSALCFIGIPFGNIFIPMLIWKKNKKHPFVDDIGRKIISFQIIWTLCSSLLLIISPFFQHLFFENINLILILGLLAVCINVCFILKIAFAFMRQEYDVFPLKIRFF